MTETQTDTFHTLVQRKIANGADIQLVEKTVEGTEVAVVCSKYADLLGTVGGAGQEVQEMGYDPVAVVEALPDLLQAVEKVLTSAAFRDDDGIATPPDRDFMLQLRSALARAEGKTNE